MSTSFLQYRLPYDNPIYIDGIVHQWDLYLFQTDGPGVMTNNDLSWADHVDHIVKKTNSTLRIAAVEKG